ncbi:hypothetical protein [Actinomadura sp. 7K507]|uniref:hypothetical protein n=1 Tax=Actinomadura sp. 7K507 TaxID=2530365 RepID=UPI00104E9A34|nr:hypothetical protein [Actinomadura sp. 7K507]TDC76788.1 hypothetical protein E1285_39585 [Actinomadura sp. 7K507]
MRTWRNDPMVRTRWILLALATPPLLLAFILGDNHDVRFTAAFVYTTGLIILLVSERIIVSTRTRPETRLANARQGSIQN